MSIRGLLARGVASLPGTPLSSITFDLMTPPLPQSGWATIPKLTSCVRGTHLSTLERSDAHARVTYLDLQIY